jgi:hypothetical protein
MTAAFKWYSSRVSVLLEILVRYWRKTLGKLGLTLSEGLVFPFPKLKLPLRSFRETGILTSP